MAELGDKVKCKVTGVVGIVTTKAKSLYGCDRVIIQPAAGNDNKVPDSMWCDDDAAEVLESKVVVGHTEIPVEKKKGGPLSWLPKK